RKEIMFNSQKNYVKSNRNMYETLNEKPVENKVSSNYNESQIDNETLQWIEDYKEPKNNRPLYVLLNSNSIWKMSRVERKRLYGHWSTKVNQEYVERLSGLQER